MQAPFVLGAMPFPGGVPLQQMMPGIGYGYQPKFSKHIFPSGMGEEIPNVALATGLHIDKRALPIGTEVNRYISNTCPETAAFTLKNTGVAEDHAIITVQRLPTDTDEVLWKKRVETYMTYKDVGLGVVFYWTVDCSNVDYGGFYGSGVTGMTISLLPNGYNVVPLPQFVVCGLANPTKIFTPSYVWNRSWRWGMAEERFMAGSKSLVLLRNISATGKVPCRLYAGGVGVLYRNRDYSVTSSIMLPICSMQATISHDAAKEWAEDASRALWSDIVLGVQTETGTTSYRPQRLAVKWKLGLFVAGAALGWVAGSMLSSYMMPTPDDVVTPTDDKQQEAVKRTSRTLEEIRPHPSQMEKPPTAMQNMEPIRCAAQQSSSPTQTG